MRKHEGIFQSLDWMTIGIYLLLVLLGWLNIYAAVYNENHSSIFDLSQNYGKQLIWVVTSLMIALVILVIDGGFYAAFSYLMYAIMIFTLIAVLLFGLKIKDTRAWFEIGSFRLQPAEFAKFATNMALAKYLSTLDIKIKDFRTKIISSLLLAFPAGLILLQNDTGSALVFGTFVFVLYREGLSRSFLIIGFFTVVICLLALLINKVMLVSLLGGIALLLLLFVRRNKQAVVLTLAGLLLACGMVFSVGYAFDKILEPHQKKRINVLLGKETDKKGAGYNVHQSMIAIGSGGFAGKGFLEGTQTKFDFVPEQSTDFIFCTVGEEWGWAGSAAVITLFVSLMLRIVFLAERQRSTYSRIYGYGVASILFFHFMVNIGMTIGLAPVIGIPLPFFSYGGSSLWAFTILLFIFIKLDSYRLSILR